MKKLLILLVLAFVCAGCGTTMSTTSKASQAVVSAQGAATQTLYGMGALLQSTPKIVDGLYASGKLTKEQFNSVVPVYNQALGSFNLAVAALKSATDAGQDPNTVLAYSKALAQFLVDKNLIENLVLSLSGQSIGGVK